MWRLRSLSILFILSLFFIPGADAKESLIKEQESDIVWETYDSIHFEARPTSRLRIDVWSDQPVYIVVMEPWDTEHFSLAFHGEIDDFDHISSSVMKNVEGDKVSNEFDLPDPSTLEDDYNEMAYYIAVIGYGPNPEGWCEQGDGPADVKVQIWYVFEGDDPREIANEPCCNGILIVPIGGLLAVFGIVILKKRK